MNTEHIVAALDELIERWTRARDLLASLETRTVRSGRKRRSRPGRLREETSASTPSSVSDPHVVTQAEAPPPVRVQVLKPHAPRQRRVVVRVSREAPKSALSGSYPTGAVVVSPEEAARGRRNEPGGAHMSDQNDSTLPGNTLDDLVRELALRSSQNLGAGQSVYPGSTALWMSWTGSGQKTSKLDCWIVQLFSFRL
jgi:hypothetical protein